MSQRRESIVTICSFAEYRTVRSGLPHKPRAASTRCIQVIRQWDPACLQVTCMGSMKEPINDSVNDWRKCPLS